MTTNESIALGVWIGLFGGDASTTLTVRYLHCTTCGKRVSTGFVALPTNTPDRGLIVRAGIECPECLEARMGDA